MARRNQEYVTAAGVKIAKKEEFEFASIDVRLIEKYINTLLEIVVDEFNTREAIRCKKTGESFVREEYVDAKLVVLTGLSRTERDSRDFDKEAFHPLLLVLPVTVDSRKSKKKSVKGELSMFSDNGAKSTVIMKEYLYQTISKYMFLDEDTHKPMIDLFKDREIQKTYLLNFNNIPKMTSWIVPSIATFNNEKYVVVMLDPVRIIASMLSTPPDELLDIINLEVRKDGGGKNFRYVGLPIPHEENSSNKKKKNKKKKGERNDLDGMISYYVNMK